MYSKIVLIYILFIIDIISCAVLFMRQLSQEDFLICKLQPNGYLCKGKKTIPKFYFDSVLKTCSTFEYGYCGLSENKFNTLDECNGICMKSLYTDFTFLKNITADLICHLQPEFGDCYEYNPMYYFDVASHTCKGFSYSGCGGNDNKFFNKMECQEICIDTQPLPEMAHSEQTVPLPNLLNETIFE